MEMITKPFLIHDIEKWNKNKKQMLIPSVVEGVGKQVDTLSWKEYEYCQRFWDFLPAVSIKI